MFGPLALQMRAHFAHKMPSFAMGIEPYICPSASQFNFHIPFFQVLQVTTHWSLVSCLLFLHAQLSNVILKYDTLLAR